MNILKTSFANVLQTIPCASTLFSRYSLQTPVNLSATLWEIIEENQLNTVQILSELIVDLPLTEQEEQKLSNTNSQLVDYVLERYHATHKQQLTQLIELSQRVESVHGNHNLCPNGLTSFLRYIETDLLSHMMKEEQVLFPMIQQNNQHMVSCPINVMRQEHTEHLQSIETLTRLSFGLTLPDDACETWQNLYQLLNEFISDLTQHIVFENNVLFVRAINVTEKAHG